MTTGQHAGAGEQVATGGQVTRGQHMAVREARIPVRDGTELAVTLYLPAQPSSPVPALLEYLPYRKDDAMLARDYELYAYMTQHGYAGARVDIRGTGRSGGELPAGEYTEQEQHDAVHYIDGLLHLDEYALMIDHLNALPPAPDYVLAEQVLRARFDSEPWLLSWLGQQQDGPYWRRASLRPDYGRLTVPAFLIGGWYDGYRDSIPRMLASCPAPVKALIG